MNEMLQNIKERAIKEIVESTSTVKLDEVRVKYFGKKGEVTSVLKNMANVSAEERPIIGQLANDVRVAIENELKNKESLLKEEELTQKLKLESIDITIPGNTVEMGHRHPLTQVIDEIKDIFIGLGYQIADGPEIEKTYYNFTALNMPENHPARDLQDTIYITEDIILRTQTSSVQARVMEKQKPPIRIICPGKVYRADTIDATHSAVFNQIEGLVVDKGITMADLKGTLELFAKKMLGEDTKIRLRPHQFNYTEPSAEVDVSCFVCGGKGCRVCKGEGWIEILGCGMVHPKVLANCGIDPEIYSGFAFGFGAERITMAKYGIDDLRVLYENDLRFLKQF